LVSPDANYHQVLPERTIKKIKGNWWRPYNCPETPNQRLGFVCDLTEDTRKHAERIKITSLANQIRDEFKPELPWRN
jgi:hypothetical protein